MGGIQLSQKGDFSKSLTFLNNKRYLTKNIVRILSKYGEAGVEALKEATPKDTGKTSESWSYDIETHDHGAKIVWSNSNVSDWANVAVLIQYGHATRNGGWVEGIDYINPAMRTIFEKLAMEAWKEVIK